MRQIKIQMDDIVFKKFENDKKKKKSTSWLSYFLELKK